MSNDCLVKHPSKDAWCYQALGHHTPHSGKVRDSGEIITWVNVATVARRKT